MRTKMGIGYTYRLDPNGHSAFRTAQSSGSLALWCIQISTHILAQEALNTIPLSISGMAESL